MGFETKNIENEDKLSSGGSGRAIVKLEVGQEVTVTVMDYAEYTRPVNLPDQPDRTECTFASLIVADNDGNEGMISSGVDGPFGEDIQKNFSHVNDENERVLKAEFKNAVVRIAKKAVTTNSGNTCHRLGYEVLNSGGQ